MVALSLTACTNSTKKVEPEIVPTHLPVIDFIKEDIKQVDSFAGGILLRTEGYPKNDSAFIRPEDFKKLAGEFFLPELDSSVFNTQFSETSLMDETTQMLNFIYLAKNSSTTLRKVIVYVSPSLSTDKVSRIYMEKEYKNADATISLKLTWKLRHYLIITEIAQTSGGKSTTRTRKAIWDPQQFSDK